MQSIQQDFPQISFAVLYVREAHPGETIPAHKNFEDKKIVLLVLGLRMETAE